jgi:DNA processing protein
MNTLRRDDRRYPPLLRRIADPPPMLWVRGEVGWLARTAVAIVGSRAASPLGIEIAERLAEGLAARDVVIVSGCARGIDAAAHRATLRAGGATVGVLAGGLDVAAPLGNRGLVERIAEEGCLLSEHPPGVAPLKHLFPLRNRIIAGLARIVVVVEASGRSGALITARLALAAGREVMAVPAHPLLPNSAGVNGLLVDGAALALSAEDVIEELARLPCAPGIAPWDAERPATPSSEGQVCGATAPPLRRRLLDALGETPLPAETLAMRIAAPMPDVLAELTQLELSGLVRAHAGQRYGRPERRPQQHRSM